MAGSHHAYITGFLSLCISLDYTSPRRILARLYPVDSPGEQFRRGVCEECKHDFRNDVSHEPRILRTGHFVTVSSSGIDDTKFPDQTGYRRNVTMSIRVFLSSTHPVVG